MKYVLVLVVALVSTASFAAFKADSTIDQVMAEVSAQKAAGKLPLEIARAAHDAHVNASDIKAALTILFNERIANESLKSFYSAEEFQTAAGNRNRDGDRSGYLVRLRTGESGGKKDDRSKSVSPS